MIETIYTPRLIVATLRADSTLGGLGIKAYRDKAPKGVKPPYIIFRRYGGNDIDVIGGISQGELTRWTVKAVGKITRQEDDALLESVATAMHAALVALAGTSYPSTSPQIHCDGLFRESAIDLAYPAAEEPDIQWRELGGIYAAYAFPIQ